MRLAYFCFIAAAVAALCGISLGIFMGMREDFTLAPVHAHINLLGWVTLAIYGLYHRGVQRGPNRLAWLQVGCGAAAVPTMTVGLAAYLQTGSTTLAPLISIGSLLAVTGMALFLSILIFDLRRAGLASGPLPRLAEAVSS
jgi:hypothetical protein